MKGRLKLMTIGSPLLVTALVLGTCSAAESPGASFPPAMAGNGYGYGRVAWVAA